MGECVKMHATQLWQGSSMFDDIKLKHNRAFFGVCPDKGLIIYKHRDVIQTYIICIYEAMTS